MIMKNIFDGQCNSLDAGHQNYEKKFAGNCCSGPVNRAHVVVTESVWEFLGPSAKKKKKKKKNV